MMMMMMQTFIRSTVSTIKAESPENTTRICKKKRENGGNEQRDRQLT